MRLFGQKKKPDKRGGWWGYIFLGKPGRQPLWAVENGQENAEMKTRAGACHFLLTKSAALAMVL